MKQLLVLICIAACFSFHGNRAKPFIPPGTVKITETFFADETEISNLAWMEYETWTKQKYGAGSAEHLKTLPDTLVWRDPDFYNEPYTIHYYRHAAYKNYPVVGISYEQAIEFCKWRTDRVKEYYSIHRKKELSIEYRLPSKEEWEMLSTNEAYFTNEGKNKKGEIMFNHRWITDSISETYFTEHNSYPDVTTPSYSYEKNTFGLYCTLGNVAEMVTEKNISKGGSWKHTIEECRPGKDILYTKPESWLGFRCVCVLKQAF